MGRASGKRQVSFKSLPNLSTSLMYSFRFFFSGGGDGVVAGLCEYVGVIDGELELWKTDDDLLSFECVTSGELVHWDIISCQILI
jgi:hypothetical protein